MSLNLVHNVQEVTPSPTQFELKKKLLVEIHGLWLKKDIFVKVTSQSLLSDKFSRKGLIEAVSSDGKMGV